MSRAYIFDTVTKYSVEEFVEFLRNNGLSEFENVATVKSIDGHTFLNLAEFEINTWKPFINPYQVQKFWSFLNQFRQFPESFNLVKSRSVVVPKPINSEHLQKLSDNESFLHSLRAAVKNRRDNRKEIPSVKQNRDDKRETAAPPPRPPTYRKSPTPNPEPVESESTDEELEVIYDSPDDEEDNKPFVSKLAKPPLKLPPQQPPVPKFPKPVKHKEIPESNFYEDVDKGSATSNAAKNSQPKRFNLQEHYNQQRALPKPPQVTSKPYIQNNPLPPLPTSKINTLPRPPKALPIVDVQELENKSVVEKPMEQESFYRYTDRKGADELLDEGCGDGTYLIRPSRTFHATLSVRMGDKVYHIGIKKIEGNKLEMESAGLDLKFNSLYEIIRHFEYSPLTVRNKYNQLVEIYLLRTLPEDRT